MTRNAPVGITMGDPSGIGPEIVVKALAQRRDGLGAVVLGDPLVIGQAVDRFAPELELRAVDAIDQVRPESGALEVFATSRSETLPPTGRVSQESGRAAFAAIASGIELAKSGRLAALVTAPINKEALAAAGLSYPGHTEILADLGGARKVAMMLANDELRVVLTTIHCSLRDAIERADLEAQLTAIRLAHDGGRRFGFETPRVAVAGLNPHAGEGGLFGREEIDVIAPAIAAARREGIDATGPWPGDTVFMQARQGRFDVVVAQYHDQGLIPVKYLGVEQGVNVTLGLPFVRTSPDHGTAFDIAGKGLADPASLSVAIDYAVRLAGGPGHAVGPTSQVFSGSVGRTVLIGVDWGTSSFRAHRIGEDGEVLETRHAEVGILKVPDGDFEGVFEREVGAWLEDSPSDLPVVLSGMITSRQGWRETGYRDCPCNIEDLSAHLTEHVTAGGRRLSLVSGVRYADPSGTFDVIRGEETQVLGCLDQRQADGLHLLPGTHSKWLMVRDGRIVWFSTFMTGELYETLKANTILGRLMKESSVAPEAFAEGLERGLEDSPESGGLLRRLFSVRTHGLFGNLPPEGLADYLSGLLIGTEVREALGCLTVKQGPGEHDLGEVVLIGGDELAWRYRRALEGYGLSCRIEGDTAARGHFAIARSAGLVP